MPYPVDSAKTKHDLLSPPLPSESLIDGLGFDTTASLFQALESNMPTNLISLAPIYSYKDAPSPPLSRELMVIGVADASLSVVRKLVGEDDDVPACLHRCTVAVKRADGAHARSLKEQDVHKAQAFAGLVRRLRKEGAVAILGQDKYHRFGILKPTDDTCVDGDFEAQDFAAACYVGRVDRVKDYIAQGVVRPKSPPVAVMEASAIDGFWKPPGAEKENGGDTGFWQPPSGVDGTNAFYFGSTSNEVDAWQPDSSNNHEDPGSVDSKFHADAGAAAADRFYSGLTRTLDTRADSRLYHMRAFNGWVKATQIQELDPKTTKEPKKVGSSLRVLDLACGKGGDLGKWVLHPRGISNYVGIDVARGSLVDAAIRVRKMRQKLKRCTFTCADLGADVPGRLKSPTHKYMQKLSTWSLEREQEHTPGDPEFKMLRGGGISLEDKFDIVSIQFAIHYMMQTKKRARRFFQTVSELLEIGGNLVATTIDARVVIGHLMNLGLDLHFDGDSTTMQPAVVETGAGACRIRFEPEIVKQIFTTKNANITDDIDERLFGLEYTFTLVEGSDHASGVGDAVNLPEWLIPIPVLRALGREAGLELEYAQNFHEFFLNRCDPSSHAAAHSSMYNMKVLNRNGSISVDEFEISRLYVALKFKKVGESKMKLEDGEEDVNADDDEPEDIDPAIKAKYFPMALLKAKKSAVDGEWVSLTSEEKNQRTEIELRKLVPKALKEVTKL